MRIIITKKQFDLISESFKQPEGTGVNSYWEDEIDGKMVRITFNDVIEHLGNEIEMDPNKIKHLLINVDRDPERIDAANLKYPIILTKSGGKFINILDGQHRVVKAIKNGVNIRVRVLDLDLAPEIFTKIFKN
jgi:hypothetical protein